MRIAKANPWLAIAAALVVFAGLVFTARPALAAEQVVTSAEVEYTFVVGEVGDFQLGDRLLLPVGHTDAIAPVFEGGELVIMTKDDTRLHSPDIVFRDPADLVFQVLPGSQISAPGFAPYEFLGPAGSPVWLLPMTQDPTLLWPGWSTEHASLAGEFTSIRYEITDVEGPGDFHLFLNDAFGGPIHRANSIGTLSNAWTEPVPAHVHSNWAFTATGVYTITFQVSGTWLNAPDPDPDPEPVETTLSITGAEGEFEPGDTVTLTAVQDPQTELDHYHWFIKGIGASDFVVIPSELEATYSFTAGLEHEGAQIIAVLYDEEHNAVAESEPVTIHVHEHDDEEPEPPGDLSQVINVTLDPSEGALVVSVDPDDRVVNMTPFELSASADSWESTGELRPVTVTDTRSAAPGWNVSGQVSDFESVTDDFAGSFLGWSPKVLSQSDGQGVTPGADVAPGFPTGDGISVGSGLASSGSGTGIGTAQLSADLALRVPTVITPGTYSALLTLTAI